MFYILTFLGWSVFHAYSGFALIILWLLHGITSNRQEEKEEQ